MQQNELLSVALVTSSSLCLIFAGMLLYYRAKARAAQRSNANKSTSINERLAVQHEINRTEIDGLFKNKVHIQVLGQITLDGIPIGGQYLVKEEYFESTDKDRIELILREYVKPALVFAAESVVLVNSGGASAFGKIGRAKSS